MAVIRDATRKDIPRLLALYEELAILRTEAEEAAHPSPEEYERVLDRIQATPGYRLLVVDESGEVVGLMSFLIMPNLSHNALPWALIESLIIDCRFRRRGLGKALVNYAIDRAKEAGCYKLALDSHKKRLEAHRFYRSLGFEDAALGFRFNF